jgi:5'-nucleotidase
LILLTNDDGIDAPGLFALARSLGQIDRVEVVAPDRNWSASGHVKTMHKPLRIVSAVLRDGTPAYACSGAPSDCVAVALLGYLKEKPDLIVSGINPSCNVGYDLTYSGTVAAAMEGAIANVPSIAVSVDAHGAAREEHYAVAAEFTARLASKVLENSLPPDTLLNVNVPACTRDELNGVEITCTGRRIYNDELVEREDPRGVKYYWIGGASPGGDTSVAGTDIWALAQNRISITPIHMDMTSHMLISKLANWKDSLSIA